VATAEDFKTIAVGFPAFAFVGQYGQAGDGGGEAIIEPVVVGEHAMGEIAVSLALNFDMDVDPAELAILEGNLDESVGKAFSQLGIAHHLT